MYTNSVTKLSIFALIALCLLAAGSRAALVHYWTLDDPNEFNLFDEGLGHLTYGPHRAQLVDPHALYTKPVWCPGKFRGAYDNGDSMLHYRDICIGGFGPAGNSIVDGTLPSPPITVSIWFYPNLKPDTDQVWYLLGNFTSGGNQDRFYISLYGPPNAADPTGICFSIGNSKDVNKYTTPVAPYNVVHQAWNHILFSVQRINSGVARVTYSLNGGPARTYDASPTLDPQVFDRGNKRLGTNGNQIESGKCFRGKFDDVAIWNELLPMPTTGFNAASFIWNGGAGRHGSVASGNVGYDPIPGDKSVGNSGITEVKWSNALRLPGTKCDVYFSTDRAELIDTTTNQPLFPTANKIATDLVGTPGSQTTWPISLTAGDDFYWRVDTKSSNPADPNVYAGPVWKFSVSNAVPQINAGPNLYRYLSGGSATINLSGTATDDGLPVGASVACTWKDPAGNPLTTSVVQVGNVYTCTATHTQTAVGYYNYTLVADDTTGEGSGTMMAVVKNTPCEAAKADPYYIKNASDIDDDCFVTFKDFALAVNTWKICTALDADCD